MNFILTTSHIRDIIGNDGGFYMINDEVKKIKENYQSHFIEKN